MLCVFCKKKKMGRIITILISVSYTLLFWFTLSWWIWYWTSFHAPCISLRNVYAHILTIFNAVVFIVESWGFFFNSLNTITLTNMWFTNIFSCSEGVFFLTFLILSFDGQKVLILISPIYYFFLSLFMLLVT